MFLIDTAEHKFAIIFFTVITFVWIMRINLNELSVGNEGEVGHFFLCELGDFSIAIEELPNDLGGNRKAISDNDLTFNSRAI